MLQVWSLVQVFARHDHSPQPGKPRNYAVLAIAGPCIRCCMLYAQSIKQPRLQTFVVTRLCRSANTISQVNIKPCMCLVPSMWDVKLHPHSSTQSAHCYVGLLHPCQATAHMETTAAMTTSGQTGPRHAAAVQPSATVGAAAAAAVGRLAM